MTEVRSWRDAPPGDYAVIGDPIAHSKSPAMHHAAYCALGLDLTYRAIHVPVGEVPQALERLREIGYRGVNVTVPHKEAAMLWAREATEEAEIVGVANTLDLVERRAHNTDAGGFCHSLANAALPEPLRIALLGAGGTSAAVLVGIARYARAHGVASLRIWNRNSTRAEALRDDLRSRASAQEDRSYAQMMERLELVATPELDGCNLIINATSTSLSGTDLGLDWSGVDPNATAYDLAYGVDEAPFLSAARRHGLATKDGREMLALQGVSALLWWNVREAAIRRSVSKGESLPKLDDLTAIMREAIG